MIKTIIKTKSLTLRQLTMEDTKMYFALLEKNRQHLSQFGTMTEAKYKTEQDVAQSIMKPQNPKKIRLGVWKNKTLIGLVSLIPRGNHRCEVGGWIGLEFTRKGYASKAIHRLATYAQKTLGYSRVIGTTHPDNLASQCMLKKSGFVPVRKLKRKHYFIFNT
ncbi:MAG: RimJ/RimL family protein N-acetyltransferase [Candidatus Azotimanducaceae bacterium]|jgi:RimJ/RimL family protein N-acetyltransferase